MARYKTRKAGKDYPESGIKKGDTYYTWSFYRGPKIRSKTPPTRSQLTNNEFLSQLYEIIDTEVPNIKGASDLEAIADTLDTLATEERDKKENLPENFQNGEQGEKYDNRADEVDAWATELRSIAEDMGEEADYVPSDQTDFQEWSEFLTDKIEDAVSSAPDPE